MRPTLDPQVRGPPSIRRRASPASVHYGSPITLAAVVKAASGMSVPQGAVTFKRGTIALGTANLDGSGKAKLSISTLAAGADSLTAVYAGNTDDATSTSTAVTVTIS
jgi:hypothetical protein